MPSLMGLDSVEVILDGLDESAKLINSEIMKGVDYLSGYQVQSKAKEI